MEREPSNSRKSLLASITSAGTESWPVSGVAEPRAAPTEAELASAQPHYYSNLIL
jgi:hypothetical protein